jgi:hypothetical protein
MPDRSDREHGRDLERELRELGSRIEYPSTPDLSRAVRRRLDDEADQPAGSRRFWPNLTSPGWAAAAVLALVLLVPALSPEVRSTVGDWFGSGSSAVESGQAAKSEQGGDAPESARPTAGGDFGSPRPESTGAAGGMPESAGPAEEGPLAESSGGGGRSLGRGLGFGERIPPREARARANESSIHLPRSPALGRPDEVYAGREPYEEGIALIYRARPGLPPIGKTRIGLILTDLPGDIESTYLAGGAPAGASLRAVNVNGEQGYWVPNGGRLLAPVGRTRRLPADVLIWEREGRSLRIEADLSKSEALRIARSVR